VYVVVLKYCLLRRWTNWPR